MEAHPHWGVVGPKLLRADGSLDLACRRSFPTPWNALMKACGLAKRFPQSRFTAGYNLTYIDPDESHPLDAIVGAFMFIRRKALAQAGPLDDVFLHVRRRPRSLLSYKAGRMASMVLAGSCGAAPQG